MIKNKIIIIDAKGLYYRDLNQKLRQLVNNEDVEKIKIKNVAGQRYLGTDLNGNVEIEIYGTPGNDLGVFMNGPRITVYGNAQDGCGNTMNEGEIIVHGHAGDILAMSMRGGKIFVKEDVGYRCAIHMKDYKDKIPIVTIGGTAQDFFGEYMAGGRVILLGLNLKKGQPHKANFLGTGMHGGIIYLRGTIREHQLGKEVGIVDLDENDKKFIEVHVNQFAQYFKLKASNILKEKFIKLIPLTLRPYGRLYAY